MRVRNKIVLLIIYCWWGRAYTLFGQINNPAPYPGVAYANVPCSQPFGSNNPSNAINDFIDNIYTTGAVVNFSNLNSGCNGLPNNYIYYRCRDQLHVAPGQTITCYIQSGTGFAQGFALWIDWDLDNAFSTAEKIGFTTGFPAAATYTTFNFVVPTSQPNGIYRMRIRSSYITSGADPLFTAISQQNYGETEDYDIYCGTQPPPPITATAGIVSTPLCAGQSLSLTAAHNITSTATYTWIGPGAFSSTLQNPILSGAQPVATGIYTVTVSNGTCPATSTISAFVSPIPSVTLSASSPVCAGETLSFNATSQGTSAPTFTWTGPASFYSTVQAPAISGAGTLATGIYSLTVSNGICTNSATVGASVLVYPAISLTAAPSVCAGQTITAYAQGTGASSLAYLWAGPLSYTNNTQNLIIPNANSFFSGNYTLTVLNGSCATTQTTAVVVQDYPVIWPASNSPLCVGQTLSFTTNAVSTIPVTYSWTGPGSFSSNQQDPTLANVTTGAAGIYTIFVGNGVCTTTGNITVNVNSNPSFSIASSSPVCAGLSLSLTATPLISSIYSYTWTGPASFSAPVQNGVIPNVTNGATGIYTVIASNGQCSASHTLNALVVDYPVFTVSPSATICAGQNLQLTASPVGTSIYAYSWNGPLSFNSSVQNPTITNAVVGSSGVYSASASFSGCITTHTTNSTVLNFPVLTLSATPLLCAGQPLNLNASTSGTTNVSFTWTGPANFSTSQQNPSILNAGQTASGIYSLTATNGFCPVSSTVASTVLDYPSITMSASYSICPGDTLRVSASAQSSITPTYAWSGPNGFSHTQSAYMNPTAVSAHSGNYSVAVSNGPCITTGTIQALVLQLPSFSIAVNSPVCVGQGLSFTTVPSDTSQLIYSWTGPSGFSSSNKDPLINSATINNMGIYSVTATGACSSTRTVQTRVYDYPVITLSAPPSLCAGATLTLNTIATTTFANTYSWTGPGGFSSTAKNPVIPSTTSSMSGVYTVSATHSICSVTSTIEVLIVDYPSFLILTPPFLCSGQTLSLVTNYVSTLATTYDWKGPAEFTSSSSTPFIQNVSTKASGIYSVVIKTMGCAGSTRTTQVIIYPLPTLTVYAISPTICLNQKTSLGVKSAASSFSWTPSNGLNTTVGDSVVAAPGHMQEYTVIASANGCTASSAITLSVLPLPQPTITLSKKLVCQDDTVTLKGHGGQQYRWNAPLQKIYDGQVVFAKINQQTIGNYTLNVTDINGCTNKAVSSVSVQPLPQGSLFGYKEAGCVPFCSTYSFMPSKVNQGASIYSKWQVKEQVISGNPFSFCFGEPGLHILSGQIIDTITKCVNHVEFQVKVYKRPQADFRFNPVKPIENLDEVMFKNATEGDELVKFNWYVFNDNIKLQDNQKDYKHLFTDGGIYTVVMIATDINQCADTAIKIIKVESEYSLYVPNAFTPNGDNLNDIFLPLCRNVHDYTLGVYDRWGHQIFYSISTETGWDGSFHGEECKSDMYVWKIVLKTNDGVIKDVAGHVWLSR